MSNTIIDTNFNFRETKSLYKGKVRKYIILKIIFWVNGSYRMGLSAFDVVMPKGIPFKGILNQIATKMMADTADIVPNLVDGYPRSKCGPLDFACEPF